MALLILALICFNLNCMKAIHMAHEQVLINNLLADYDPLVRPVFNHKLPLNVSVSIEMTQGIEILEKEQILVTSLLIEQVNTVGLS